MLGVNTPALPASLRRTNQRTVLSLLMRLGAASKADLAKAAGISQPTAGKITDELLRLGVLREVSSQPVGNGRQKRRLGRPAQLLRLDNLTPRFLALHVGVAETRASALPVSIQLADDWTHRFQTPKTPEQWVDKLKEMGKPLGSGKLWGVSVGVPGIVDEASGKVLFSPNLHWLERINLPELLGGIWNLPVVLVQEIRALALGQLTAQPGGEDFFLVDFGEGVGGAIVLDGKIYEHPVPLSGEFGHTPVAGNPRRCGCGAVGCLETLTSRHGLLESYSAAAKVASPPWKALVQDVTANGLPPWLKAALDATANVVAGALNMLGIRRVVVTGLLTELPGAVDHLAAGVKEGALWGRFGEVSCQAAPRRRAAGLVAAGIDRLVVPESEEKGIANGS